MQSTQSRWGAALRRVRFTRRTPLYVLPAAAGACLFVALFIFACHPMQSGHHIWGYFAIALIVAAFFYDESGHAA